MGDVADISAVERRREELSPTKSTTPAIYVYAVVLLAVLVIIGILTLSVLQPSKDHTPTITMMMGFVIPIITALLGGAVVQLGKAVDGRLNQLLAMTARTHAAEGELIGQQKVLEKAVVVAPIGVQNTRKEG